MNCANLTAHFDVINRRLRILIIPNENKFCLPLTLTQTWVPFTRYRNLRNLHTCISPLFICMK